MAINTVGIHRTKAEHLNTLQKLDWIFIKKKIYKWKNKMLKYEQLVASSFPRIGGRRNAGFPHRLTTFEYMQMTYAHRSYTRIAHTLRTHTHWKWQITKYVYQNAFRRSTKITIKILHRRIILNAFNRKPVALIAFRYVNSNAAMLWFIWKMQSVQFTKAKSLREARILEHGRNHKSTQTQTRWNCTMIRTKKKKNNQNHYERWI